MVGAAGEEIDVDKYGRVEVEFRWDRRDQHCGCSSRRVRVAQGWAGAGFGFVMLPRVNEEVIVAYLEGDPDQPIIVGRVHNAFVTSPLSLPAEKTVSAWRSRSSPGGNGYNEIRMDDQAGAERFDVHAQRDFQLVVERHLAQNVVGNASQAVKGDCSMSADKDTTISTKGTLSLHGDSYVELTSDGELAIRAPTHIDLAKSRSIGADDIRIVGKKIVLETPSGGSSITITSGGIEIKSDGDVVVNGAVVKLNCE